MEEEKEYQNFNLEEIEESIRKFGYFTLPQNTNVQLVIERRSKKNYKELNQLGENKPKYGFNAQMISRLQLVKDVMVGEIKGYSLTSNLLGLTLTSTELIQAEEELKEWETKLTEKYQIPDKYILKEHNKPDTSTVDINLYLLDYPYHKEEILNTEKELNVRKDFLQQEVNLTFLQDLGLPTTREELTSLTLYISAD